MRSGRTDGTRRAVLGQAVKISSSLRLSMGTALSSVRRRPDLKPNQESPRDQRYARHQPVPRTQQSSSGRSSRR